MLYREHPPSRALSAHVECAWSLEPSAPVTNYSVPPDGCIDIVYDRAIGLRVIGTMTRAQNFAFDRPPVLAGIRFRPGMARSFIGIPAQEITDDAVFLEDARARELRDQLDHAQTMEHASAILINAFIPQDAISPIQLAIAALTRSKGIADLDWIAQQANLSPRHFRRRCLDETGLTPKHLCRILRFRFASQLAAANPKPNWPGIAAEAGYFDQAHLIRDFREFTGHPPTSVFSNTR